MPPNGVRSFFLPIPTLPIFWATRISTLIIFNSLFIESQISGPGWAGPGLGWAWAGPGMGLANGPRFYRMWANRQTLLPSTLGAPIGVGLWLSAEPTPLCFVQLALLQYSKSVGTQRSIALWLACHGLSYDLLPLSKSKLTDPVQTPLWGPGTPQSSAVLSQG